MCGVLAGWALPASAQGDIQRGAAHFQQCAACHSLEPGRHQTGPSLAGVYGRKAGTAEGFSRYSEALQRSGLVWNQQTLDRWLRNPQAVVPGTGMAFRGVADARARGDLVAYLKAASEGKTVPAARGGMAMMEQGPKVDLRQAGRERLVTGIHYCRETYRVATAAGQTLPFWEFNLRFKTDSSGEGPHPGRPVLVTAGMMGDRAFVVFASPEEMTAFIKRQCD